MEFVFTKPKLSDAKEAMRYVNALVDEGAYIATQKKKTLKEERAWIRDTLKKMRKKDAYVIFVRAKDSNKLIAIGDVQRRALPASAHVATLGISVKKEYRNKGIGTILLRKLVEEARKLPRIETVHLAVYSINTSAIHLYEKNGFTIVAKTPRWAKFNGIYTDSIDMYYVGK